jgi:polysaccharide export outer membrane protein
MMKLPMRSGVLFAALSTVFFCTLISCTNTRHLTYMQGSFDTTKLSKVDYPEPVIRRGDILSIVIYSDNPAATAIFNQMQLGGSGNPGTGGGGTTTGGSTGQPVSSSTGGSSGGSSGSGGYLVDESGNIEFYQLGVIHVDSITRSQLKDTLDTRLKPYLQNPYCTIRFLNYRFTMLGEISHPGVFNMPGEHLNLLEALGLGGDLTFYGRRDNVLVIRQNEDKREFARLDLTKPDVIASPYFTIQPNDIIYIEANKKKVVASDQTTLRNISIATSVISTLAILYTLFK